MARVTHLARPPRSVSLPLLLSTVVGGILGVFGWVFFGFGMIFVWIFAAPAHLWSLESYGPTEVVMGEAVRSRGTNASENEVEVVEVIYRYTTLDGDTFEGRGFTTGIYYDPQEPLEVRYLRRDPARSAGSPLRDSMFGAGALIVLVFPLFGLIFIVVSGFGGLKTARLLIFGALAHGRRIRREETSTRVNGKPVYKYTFEFRSAGGATYQCEYRTNRADKVEDEAEEALLYDPRRPERATVLDGLVVKWRVTPSGGLESASAFAVISLLLAPGITIVGHGLYWLSL